ncbi:MAG: nucleotide exchange factor GrpE, partial [Gammaproteobacteria bacterium]|nr:nucleotide exchange factor GrpE [Gammaproteobacteria bacterium]
MEKEQETVADNETVTDEKETAAEEPVEIETEAPAAGTALPDQAKLVLMLEDARAKADENWDQVVRTRAEMDNLRKRQARELENAHKFALERFVNALLPVRDSMEMGLGAASEEGADVAKLREGAELTLKLMADVMAKFDVVQIDPLGEPFNPELHQAMSMTPRSDVPPNTV